VPDSTFLKRVALRNYKSIATCDVGLGPLMFLVGPNGSGKSNFLDALRFVADSLRTTLDQALRDRSGIGEVRRRSGGRPNNFSIHLDFHLPEGQEGSYAFLIGAKARGGFEVQMEECSIRGRNGASMEHFQVQCGKVTSSTSAVPAASPDRLFLVSASGLPEFRPVFEALSRMGFYNLIPDRIRDLQSPDSGDMLSRDGGNLASVLRELKRYAEKRKKRIEEYLSRVAPGVTGVDAATIGPKESIRFLQTAAGSKESWDFLASNMSDGTLRALGVLVSLFQSGNGSRPRVPLVGIEEPETALHPAAAGVLLDSLKEASRETQVIVTSHSPDLLDDDKIDPEAILAVDAESGSTVIGHADETSRSLLRDRLYTAGELLRTEQLRPAPAELVPPSTQGSLFEQRQD
jgi:predicted ATPase